MRARGLVAVALSVVFAGCSIRTQVDPLAPGTVTAVCIQKNDAVWGKDFLAVLQEQFVRHGIAATTFSGDVPADCRHVVWYTANWSWDIASYMIFCDIKVMDGDRTIARATYDASAGTGNLGKFASTTGKIEHLMNAMLGPPTSG
jgi:hypothetical protein